MSRPTLTTFVRRALAEAAFPPGTRLLVAVSGGPDSLACLHALALAAPRAGVTLLAHGVDHGLRAGAAEELALAADLAARLAIPFAKTTLALPPGGNLHARARDARYAALEAAREAADAAAIVTAHHRGDRAETVLSRLLHGAGLEALAVLPLLEARRFRPIIAASRADVLAHVSRHGLATAHDPSNDDPRFFRARVRHELLPALAAAAPQIEAHLAALADEACAAFGPSSRRPLGLRARRTVAEALARGATHVPITLPGGRPAVVVPVEKIGPSSRKSRV